MKKILSIFIIIATVSILLISNNTIAGPAWFAPSGVKTSTECNAAAYYAYGTLCQDTDDNKLYLGTGAAVQEILNSKHTFVDGSSSVNLTVAQVSSTVIGNPTQTGNVTHVLPAIEAGLGFDAILGLTAAFYFRLDPNANDSIYLDGVSCGDGKYIGLTTVTVGDAISCRAMKTGASSYDWACYTAKGAFTCE